MGAQLVCVRCGRIGTRGFSNSSGDGSGSRDTYRCTSAAACERRERAADFAMFYRVAAGPRP